MGLSEEEWDRFSQGSPVRQAKRSGFLRNVAVALGNWGAQDVVPALVNGLSDPEPLTRGHEACALGRVASGEARYAIEERLGVEDDPFVREELASALEI